MTILYNRPEAEGEEGKGGVRKIRSQNPEARRKEEKQCEVRGAKEQKPEARSQEPGARRTASAWYERSGRREEQKQILTKTKRLASNSVPCFDATTNTRPKNATKPGVTCQQSNMEITLTVIRLII